MRQTNILNEPELPKQVYYLDTTLIQKFVRRGYLDKRDVAKSLQSASNIQQRRLNGVKTRACDKHLWYQLPTVFDFAFS